MSGGKQQQDPTMDEILSSIRKIIEHNPPSPASAAPEAPAAASRAESSGPTLGLGLSLGATPRRGPARAIDDDVLLLTNLVPESSALRPAADSASAAATPNAASIPSPAIVPPADVAPPPGATVSLAQAGPLNVVHAPIQPQASHKPLADQPAAADPIRSAMDRLARAVHDAEPQIARIDPGPVVPAGRTLEDIVSDLLRPMLQEWVDKNLPALVERTMARDLKERTKP